LRSGFQKNSRYDGNQEEKRKRYRIKKKQKNKTLAARLLTHYKVTLYSIIRIIIIAKRRKAFGLVFIEIKKNAVKLNDSGKKK
jgi:hypothetical protein